jgi:Fibronectin type III domain
VGAPQPTLIGMVLPARIPLAAALAAALALVVGVAREARALPPAGALPPVTVQVADTSAVVTWRVDDAPSWVVVEYGVDGRYGSWSPTTAALSSGLGRTTLTGLEPGTAYQFHVIARSQLGWLDSRGSFRTAPSIDPKASIVAPTGTTSDTSIYLSAPVAASSGPTALYVNGSPLFPRMVWRECPYAYAQSLAAGINLFLGTSCTTAAGQLSTLGGRAFSALDYTERGAVAGPGLIGWHLPDEADEAIGKANGLPTIRDSGRVTFITLTDHFSPRMAPPSAGRGIYPGYFARSDVIGFDTYPLEGRCRLDLLDWVYVLQQDLVKMAGSKPTFQWIEAGPMEKCFHIDPTPATVKAETWLAIAGGARGIGYFPDVWSDPIQAQITSINRDIVALAPALLDETGTAYVGSADKTVRVGVRRHNGAIYVIAVNESPKPTSARIAVAGLGSRTIAVFGEGRTVDSQGDLISDSFSGLGVHIYIAPPPGW